MANFKIKYLDSYPVYSYYDSFEQPEVVFDGYYYEVIKTENKWGHVYDSIKDNRTTQYIVYEVYKAEILIGRNIDLFVLQGANHVLVTPDYGEEFNALNFTIDITDSANRDKFATITFHKEMEIRYPLSSEYAESLHSDLPVNKIAFDVDNPAYSFNNVTIKADEVVIGIGYQAYFDIEKNDLTDTLDSTATASESYYLHTDNPDFNDEKDISGFYLNGVTIHDKTTYYRCYCSTDNIGTGTFTYTLTNVIIDHNPNRTTLRAGITVSDKTISIDIYTFIEPYFSHDSAPIEGYEAPSAVEENQIVNEKDIASLKIWLKEDEKWKAEYLRHALNYDIELDLVNYDDIIPVQTKDIIEKNENNNLIDLFEYDLKFIYNVKSINLFR